MREPFGWEFGRRVQAFGERNRDTSSALLCRWLESLATEYRCVKQDAAVSGYAKVVRVCASALAGARR